MARGVFFRGQSITRSRHEFLRRKEYNGLFYASGESFV